ncbi:hypothetical protein [Hydrogenovibrio kuenenii]|uniref:hypothetical protein n=1 Tax=Hydrogenovibrio kuenenii TaxID=63658 RepID=UPI000467D732|nr:hypothetical protein [Hydrogenovibrio kuenenii]
MMKLLHVLTAWNTPDFKNVLNTELQQLEKSQLPLQQGLAVSNRVADSDISFMLLNAEETEQALLLTVLVFYNGIVAGDCCADDPTPVCEQPEQCTLRLTIYKPNGEVEVTLLAEDE